MAITVGLSIEQYWDLNPKQFEKYIKVYIENEKKRLREADTNNFNLGKYIAYAVNDPKKYPRKPFLEDKLNKMEMDEVVGREMSVEEMEEMMKRNTIILGGKIKKNGKRNS